MNLFWLAQFRKDFLWAYSYKISFFGQFFAIFMTLFTFYFISETFSMSESPHLEQYNNNYFLFAIIGICTIDFISSGLRSATKSIREAQAFGYIDMIVNAKITLQYFLICSLIYPCFIGLIRALLFILVAGYIYNLEMSPGPIALALLVIILTLISFLGVSLFASSFVLAFKQGDPINIFITITLTICSGVVFPISVLPDYIQSISNIIPITHGIEIVRKMVIFNSVDHFSIKTIFYLLFTSVLLMCGGIILVTFTTNWIKKNGTSGRY